MLFGRKKSKKVPCESFGVSKQKKPVSAQVEIDLACRDLMLASLESMRKEAISRPASKRADNPADFFPLEQDSQDLADQEVVTEILEGSPASSDKQSAGLKAGVESSVAVQAESCVKKDQSIEQSDRAGQDKQQIIDMIVAEDIMRAFSRGKTQEECA